MKTSYQGPGRMVQDASYWTSFLRQKITFITQELKRMQLDVAESSQDQENTLAFEQRYEGRRGSLIGFVHPFLGMQIRDSHTAC